MSSDFKKLACLADHSDKAQATYAELVRRYSFEEHIEECDAILALGGDGFMLHTLHMYIDSGIPIYGINCGSVGFLMNEYHGEDLIEKLQEAKLQKLHPLQMKTTDKHGKTYQASAINEVSLLRYSRQAAHLRVKIDGTIRIENLVCDGILLATPAGSTAYNLSVHGPILPISSKALALTPIAPFRPRRWKGALLSHKTEVTIDIIDSKKRPVNAVADFTEVTNVESVHIFEDTSKEVQILFDRGHSLEERIISEQFAV